VYSPFPSMLPPAAPSATDQIAPVSVVPVTLALNESCPLVAVCARAGEREMETSIEGAGGGIWTSGGGGSVGCGAA